MVVIYTMIAMIRIGKMWDNRIRYKINLLSIFMFCLTSESFQKFFYLFKLKIATAMICFSIFTSFLNCLVKISHQAIVLILLSSIGKSAFVSHKVVVVVKIALP